LVEALMTSHHVLVDGHGAPLALRLSPANRHNSQVLEPALDAVPPPRGRRGGVDSSEKLGRHRWVIERAIAWIRRLGRLTVRYERRADIHHAFLVLAGALVAFQQLIRFC
jgi:transposase